MKTTKKITNRSLGETLAEALKELGPTWTIDEVMTAKSGATHRRLTRSNQITEHVYVETPDGTFCVSVQVAQ